MLDPAGDGKNPGRTIENSFERGLTLKIAEQLERLLKAEYPYLRVVISRKPGQLLDQPQIAQFSNRTGINFFLSIHCYHEQASRPSLTLYHMIRNPTTDWWQQPAQQPTLLPAKLAYIQSLKTTKSLMNVFSESLSAQTQAYGFHFVGGFSLPLRTFYGIAAPALVIECGLRTEKDIDIVIPSLKNAIVHVLHKELGHE